MTFISNLKALKQNRKEPHSNGSPLQDQPMAPLLQLTNKHNQRNNNNAIKRTTKQMCKSK